jgi:hypothetical protein
MPRQPKAIKTIQAIKMTVKIENIGRSVKLPRKTDATKVPATQVITSRVHMRSVAA